MMLDQLPAAPPVSEADTQQYPHSNRMDRFIRGSAPSLFRSQYGATYPASHTGQRLGSSASEPKPDKVTNWAAHACCDEAGVQASVAGPEAMADVPRMSRTMASQPLGTKSMTMPGVRPRASSVPASTRLTAPHNLRGSELAMPARAVNSNRLSNAPMPTSYADNRLSRPVSYQPSGVAAATDSRYGLNTGRRSHGPAYDQPAASIQPSQGNQSDWATPLDPRNSQDRAAPTQPTVQIPAPIRPKHHRRTSDPRTARFEPPAKEAPQFLPLRRTNSNDTPAASRPSSPERPKTQKPDRRDDRDSAKAQKVNPAKVVVPGNSSARVSQDTTAEQVSREQRRAQLLNQLPSAPEIANILRRAVPKDGIPSNLRAGRDSGRALEGSAAHGYASLPKIAR